MNVDTAKKAGKGIIGLLKYAAPVTSVAVAYGLITADQAHVIQEKVSTIGANLLQVGAGIMAAISVIQMVLPAAKFGIHYVASVFGKKA